MEVDGNLNKKICGAFSFRVFVRQIGALGEEVCVVVDDNLVK